MRRTINDATAKHAINSIDQLLEQVSEIIVSNAKEWSAGDDGDATAHATATLGIAFKLLAREVLFRFPQSVNACAEATLAVMLDASLTSIQEVKAQLKE